MDDATLAASLGAAFGNASLTVTSSAAEQTTVAYVADLICPKGAWCTAGLVVECPIGSYNELEGQDYATACVSCPEYSTTLNASSTSVSECICESGFEQTIAADGTATCECAAGYEIVNGVRCDPCGASDG